MGEGLRLGLGGALNGIVPRRICPRCKRSFAFSETEPPPLGRICQDCLEFANANKVGGPEYQCQICGKPSGAAIQYAVNGGERKVMCAVCYMEAGQTTPSPDEPATRCQECGVKLPFGVNSWQRCERCESWMQQVLKYRREGDGMRRLRAEEGLIQQKVEQETIRAYEQEPLPWSKSRTVPQKFTIRNQELQQPITLADIAQAQADIVRTVIAAPIVFDYRETDAIEQKRLAYQQLINAGLGLQAGMVVPAAPAATPPPAAEAISETRRAFDFED